MPRPLFTKNFTHPTRRSAMLTAPQCPRFLLAPALLAAGLTQALPAPAPAAEPAKTKVVLIGAKPDHPHATHMYMHECRLLAKCLNQNPGVEAVAVQGWPDAKVLRGVKAVVFYSPPAGDIALAGPGRKEFQKLMDDGVGFVAIHWATG